MKKQIFIVGLPASGKTTFGRALAAALCRDFIDLDFYITQRFHASVSEIFAHHGEETFRRRESSMLREVGEMTDIVVSCGGGTPCFGSNMEFMNTHGTTVLLKASEERLLERLSAGRHKRPLVQNLSEKELSEYIRATTASRAPFYDMAAICIESSRLENRSEISETVDKFLSEHPDI